MDKGEIKLETLRCKNISLANEDKAMLPAGAIVEESKQKYPLNIESIDLEITSKCNLRCSYCYVGTGKHPMGDMSDETIEQVFDLIEIYGHPRPTVGFRNGKQFQIKATTISFYGGEPFLVFDRMKYFILRSLERGMKLNFTALSNGTLGTPEQVNFLKGFNIWTQRSIDGHPEAQEKYRQNSIKSYEAKSKEVWKDFDYSRRMTVQPEFAKDLMKSFKYFEEQGFKAGMSPMPNFYTEWTDEQIQDFKNSLWELGKYYVERWKQDKNTAFYIYYFANEIRGRFQKQSKFGCGGSRGLHCVSWDGYMYMCHRFSKDPYDSDVCFGHIKDVLNGTAKGYGENLLKQTEKFRFNKKEDWLEMCRNCEAQEGCEKGCVHTNFECTKAYDTPPRLYCELRKETHKIISWIDEQLRDLDRDWWKRGNTLSTRGISPGQGCQINCGAN